MRDAAITSSFQLAELWPQLPLLVLVVGGLAVLLADAFSKGESRKWLMWLSVGVCAATLLSAWLVSSDVSRGPLLWMEGLLVIDKLGLFFVFIFTAGTALALMISGAYLEEHEMSFGEYYPLMLFALAGMILLAWSADMVTLFIGLETMSLAVYVLTGSSRKSKASAEAAMKYFIMGAFASGFLVYGMALCYGASGTTNLFEMGAQADVLSGQPVFLIGMYLTLAALLFKVAAVPFHMWAPDAYEGAPTPVTGFMAAGVKAAGFAILLRMVTTAFGGSILPYGGFGWAAVVGVIAAATMTWGNVAALRQDNIKRMLAYSSIAHAGYLLLGILAVGTGAGAGASSSLLFYLAAYTFTTMGAFGVMAWVGGRGEERVLVDDWNGLGSKHPAAALAMTIFLLSLAGVPPTGGFFGKFYLFKSAMDVPDQQLLWLVILGVLNSVVSVFYYLRIIVAMYFRDPRGAAFRPIRDGALTVAIVIAVLMVVEMGLMPSFWLGLAGG